jgi:dTDP-4-amino-4,6-dideoxygalactose transaminase
VLESGWLAEGPVTRQFEDVVAKYVGAKHAIAVSNCTVALTLALKGENVHGKIAVPSFTHPATIQAVLNADCTPVLSDVELVSYNMDVDSTVGLLGAELTSLMPVSWAGNPQRDYPYANTIIEDAACSLGSRRGSTRTGSVVTTCFSFHPRKVVTTGEGGMVVTNSQNVADKIRSLKNFGEGGGNWKFDDVRAAIGLAQMGKIEQIINRRIEMAEIYNELLDPVSDVKPPYKEDWSRHTYQTYAVYLEKGDRDLIIKKLAEQGIETQIGTYALHLLPQFSHVQQLDSLENSTKLYNHLLALPMAYDMTQEDQQIVVDTLKHELV